MNRGCEVCTGYPSASGSFYRVDLVRHENSWKRWTCCSQVCAEAFVVGNIVRYAERLDEDGFKYVITRVEDL